MKISKAEKKTIEIDLKCLYNVMNNFEDDLCEQMQEKIVVIKQFIEKQQQKLEEKETLYQKALTDLVIAEKMVNEMAEHIVSSAIVDDTVCAIKCDCETDILEDCTHEKMLNCTKEYFRKKVE